MRHLFIGLIILSGTLGHAVTLTRTNFNSVYKFDRRVEALPTTLTVTNPGTNEIPAVYIIGQPDTNRTPVRLTKGLTLNGIRLTERLLSESVLILYPDGTGKWGYSLGFNWFSEPDFRDGRRIDPATLLEYSKWKYDPLTRPYASLAQSDRTICMLDTGGKPQTPLRYEIAFPDTMRIRRLAITPCCAANLGASNVAVNVRLYADVALKNLVAGETLGVEHRRQPVVFSNLDLSRVVVEISAKSPHPVYLAFGPRIEADLDTRHVKLPVLQTGVNTLIVGDDGDSSHQARVVLCWGGAKPREKAVSYIPEHVRQYRSPYARTKPRQRAVPLIDEWFPMGFYDGTLWRSETEVVWLLDQMKKLHMNTIYISNGNLDGRTNMVGLVGILPLANARGIRLIYQGTSPGALYHWGRTKQERLRNLERIVLPTARKRLPEFKDNWSILAWSLCEEIPPEYAAELTPYYNLVRELTSNQPPTMLYSGLDGGKADMTINHPLVITHDCYPFFSNPYGGNPASIQASLKYYQSSVRAFYKACQEHGARLWMMPQACGLDAAEAETAASLDPPVYGERRGARRPQPGELKMQGWLAVAEGACGVMFYAAISRTPGRHNLWDYAFRETESTRAAGELFAQLEKVAPLLCRLERDFKDDGFVELNTKCAVANTFIKRKGYAGTAQYVIMASLDGLEPKTVAVKIKTNETVYDMVTRQPLSQAELAAIQLGPGEGRVLFVGSREDFQNDVRMIEEQLDRYYRDSAGFWQRMFGR